MKKVNILLFLILCFSSIKANVNVPKESNQSNIEISILTCAPGKEIYTLFGHTAIRVQIPDQYYDRVFNYGIFNFNSSNFALRFALGETDYQLAETPYDYFIYEYNYYKRDVWEQTLNLTDLQKLQIIEALRDNLKPENIVYRYNYFYDNCSTRPLDKILTVIPDLNLPKNVYEYPISYRDCIYKYAENNLWSRFGMNFCIGPEGDYPINTKQLSFAPLELMTILDKTYTSLGKLTNPTIKILSFNNEKTNALIPNPTLIFSILAFLIAIISYKGYRSNRSLYIVDVTIFSLFGIAGIIIAFLAVFSEHPAVSYNYLLIVFHPLHLIIAPILGFKERNRRKIYYHYGNTLILTLFILFSSLIPQRIEFAILPLTLCMWIRSLTYIFLLKKNNK